MSTRIAARRAEGSCSGRLTRSQNFETGLKQSLTETSYERASSSSCNTGLATRVAKMSPGRSSTGSRLTVATAAPVTMFVAPGPMDVVHASVASRFFARANADAVCTIACSLRTSVYGSSFGSRRADSSNASPTPATFPCPKIPKQPCTSRCSMPSRSLYWFTRNSTRACPTVSRRVRDMSISPSL